MKLFMEVPWPPSGNTYYRRGRYTTYLSPAGSNYLRDFRDYVSDNQFPKLGDSPVKLHVILRVPDKRKRDIDNCLKAIFDGLESSGIIEDDSQIEELYVKRGELLKGGRVILIIEAKDD